jgi:Histone RNA hairpin-binding protein RNA-binding domain
VPKAERSTDSAEHPQTPNPHVKRSKRAFEGLLTVWRRQLHAWDPPVTSDEVLAMPLSPAVDTAQGFTDGDATAMDVVGTEDTATADTAAAAAAVAAATAAAVSRELSAAVDIYGDGEIDGDELGGSGTGTNGGSAADSSTKSEDIFGTREDCELPSDDDEDDDLL